MCQQISITDDLFMTYKMNDNHSAQKASVKSTMEFEKYKYNHECTPVSKWLVSLFKISQFNVYSTYNIFYRN